MAGSWGIEKDRAEPRGDGTPAGGWRSSGSKGVGVGTQAQGVCLENNKRANDSGGGAGLNGWVRPGVVHFGFGEKEESWKILSKGRSCHIAQSKACGF